MKLESSASRKAIETPKLSAIELSVTLLYDSRNWSKYGGGMIARRCQDSRAIKQKPQVEGMAIKFMKILPWDCNSCQKRGKPGCMRARVSRGHST